MVKKRSPGRPKKPPEHRRGTDLRIPVTDEEKELIQQAALKASDNGEMAGWARSVLVTAAKRLVK